MKQQIIKQSILFSMLAFLMISGCKKEEFPSKTVEVSQPTINLIGDPVIILHVGDTYTDQGATYYDSLYGDNGILSTTTEISTDQEGFFIVTYSAKNKYGFEGSGTRLVAVTEADDLLDVSGEYYHAARGGTAMISKVGRGVFVTDNVAGGSTLQSAYFMFTADSTMVMPTQYLPAYVCSANFIDPVYDFSATPLPTYSYEIDGPAFGTGQRLFEKQ